MRIKREPVFCRTRIKNGKRIFEGDIIRHYNRATRPGEYDIYKIEFDMRGCMWAGRYNNSYAAHLRDYLEEHYEGIGNLGRKVGLPRMCVDLIVAIF